MTVYFVLDRVNQQVKIGHTIQENYYVRIRQIERADNIKLVVLGSVPGDTSVEKSMHRKFAHLKVKERQSPEWFYAVPELMQWIKQNTKLPLSPRQMRDTLDRKQRRQREKDRWAREASAQSIYRFDDMTLKRAMELAEYFDTSHKAVIAHVIEHFYNYVMKLKAEEEKQSGEQQMNSSQGV